MGNWQERQRQRVLFLVALDDRKMRIEVGYGLESIITDGRAGRIRDEDVLPDSRKMTILAALWLELTGSKST